MRRSLLTRGRDLKPSNCAKCGKRMIMGIILAVKIDGEKFRVCSFECEKALKESRDK